MAKTKTHTPATIYFPNGLGTWSRLEVKDLLKATEESVTAYKSKSVVHYRETLRHKPKGYSFEKLVVLSGHNHPDPTQPLSVVDGDVTRQTFNYGDNLGFEEKLSQYLDNNPELIILDTRKQS